MLTLREIVDKIGLAVEEVSLGVWTAPQVSEEVRLMGDLNLDSLDYATVLVLTEDATGIKIKEDGINWREIETVLDLAKLFLKNQ